MATTNDAKSNISEIEEVLLEAKEEETVIRDISIHRGYAYQEIESEENAKQATLITDILNNYTNQQKDRFNYKSRTQKFIFWFLMALVAALTAALIAWISYLFKYHQSFDIPDIIGLVTSCITYLSSLLTIFLVIVKYVFPEDEEKNFNELVSNIIKNHTDRLKNEYDFILGRDDRNNGKKQ